MTNTVREGYDNPSRAKGFLPAGDSSSLAACRSERPGPGASPTENGHDLQAEELRRNPLPPGRSACARGWTQFGSRGGIGLSVT